MNLVLFLALVLAGRNESGAGAGRNESGNINVSGVSGRIFRLIQMVRLEMPILRSLMMNVSMYQMYQLFYKSK
jgi:hypothetical protein